jgi:hypothetical protein
MKKQHQLGMNPSTASGRLVKDLLWNFVETTGQSACCKCGEPMSRETFSIEHVTPWLDSEDPVGLYFDLENISYSHRACNIKDARRGKYDSEDEAKEAHLESSRQWKRKNRTYCPDERRERYLRLNS